MRSDLEKACLPCGLRLPALDVSCPWCGSQVTAATATPPKRSWLARLRGEHLHPTRDLFLYVPAALGYIIAGFVALHTARGTLSSANGISIGMAAIGALAAFDGAVLAFALLWILWATAVTSLSAILGLSASPIRLRALPQPWLDKPSTFTDWVPKLEPVSLRRYVHWRKKDFAPFFIGALFVWGAEIVVAFLAHPIVDAASAAAFASTAGIMLVLTFVGGAMAWIPTSYTLASMGFVAERISRAVAAVAGRRHEMAARRGAPDLERLQRERAHVTGHARRVGTPEAALVAPLSGRPCLAFRVIGKVGDVTLDDAEGAAFGVVHGEATTTIRATRWIVALPMSEPVRCSLTADQRERLARFLRGRVHVTTFDHAELAETRLDEGECVEVWGATGFEEIDDAYRGTQGARPLISDADAKPLVVVPSPRDEPGPGA